MPVPTSLTRRSSGCLSATWFAGVTAAVLPLPNLDEVVPEHEIQFLAKGHWGGHVSEESPDIRPPAA